MVWSKTAVGCAVFLWLSCGISPSIAAQTATDGAIGGRALSAAGSPIEGALVVVQELETGLTLKAVSGKHGEFLVTRLPVGDYMVIVADAGVEITLPGPIEVELGEVTEVEACMHAPAAGKPNASAEIRAALTDSALVALPVNGGAYQALARSVPGANEVADSDETGDVSFRGVAVGQNSIRIDGTSGEEGFTGGLAGAGVSGDPDAGSDDVADRSSGVGAGSRSVADGGRRTGSAYVFSQAAVREFRMHAQLDATGYGSAMYGHGVGGVVTTVSRSGSSRIHGMAFYTVRDSELAAANPFSIASTYTNGVITNAVVKPMDVRHQFGGRIGGPLLEPIARYLGPEFAGDFTALLFLCVR
jgi:hypothetical protein